MTLRRALVGLTLLITAISASVRSLSQPSFFSTPTVNSGYPSLISEILGIGPVGQHVDLHGRAVRPLLLALDAEAGAEHAAAVHRGRGWCCRATACPGCLTSGEPQHGQGRP